MCTHSHHCGNIYIHVCPSSCLSILLDIQLSPSAQPISLHSKYELNLQYQKFGESDVIFVVYVSLLSVFPESIRYGRDE